MIPYKEINPFLLHLAWQGVKGIGAGILCIAALIWLAGWISMAPLSIAAMWLDGECPLWGMLLAEAFWILPALIFGLGHLTEAWEHFLLRKGYTKS